MTQPEIGSRLPVLVWKLGGSLLTLPDFASRLQTAMQAAAAHRPLLVVGGGATADLVRGWDRQFQLGDVTAHWLALQAMELNEALVAAVLADAVTIANREAAERAWHAGRLPILQARQFVLAEESNGASPLPTSWDVTADTIAAWVAVRWPASGIVLVKSTAVTPRSEPDDAVDPYFEHFAQPLANVTWCNLRDDSPCLLPWESSRHAHCSEISSRGT